MRRSPGGRMRPPAQCFVIVNRALATFEVLPLSPIATTVTV
jgi:hypothetical protein